MRQWAELGPRFMPFADIATPDLPFTRLLRLSLFQVSVGMAMVLLVGTLNRVMIVELDVPASLVGVMLALPIAFAPFRALIGHRSDTHRSALGWRRVPYIYNGTLALFGAFAIMPFAVLVLAGKLEAANAPVAIGYISAALAFLLAGAGIHITQTAGLALATDLTPPESHARVVGLMYVMLLLGMTGSALLFGALLSDFTPGRLIQVIQGVAVSTVVLNFISLWKQEPRRPSRDLEPVQDPTFLEAWSVFRGNGGALRALVIVALGTLAFNMADVLLEPFGGEVLALSVSETTRLTALFAIGGLAGFALASRAVGQGTDPFAMAWRGALLGLPAFALIIGAVPLGMPVLFQLGNFLIGFGGALFAHGTLTATMNRAPQDQAGLALGAWGAVQATAAGAALAVSSIVRDVAGAGIADAELPLGFDSAAGGYLTVYAIEIVLLVVTCVVIVPLLRRGFRRPGAEPAASAQLPESAPMVGRSV